MSRTTNRRLDDLASLLNQVRFSHDHADYRESLRWRVFVYPRRGKGDRFDALVSVIPRKGREELGGELLLTVSGRGSFWLARETTDSRGQVWFRDLPNGDYSPHLATMPVPVPPGRVTPMRRTSHPGGKGGAQESPRAGRWPSYVLHDRRVSAVLSMEKSGLAVLRWKALDPGMAGIRIGFQMAGETGEVTLNPKGASGRPTAKWLLQQPYRDIASFLPRFTIKKRTTSRGD